MSKINKIRFVNLNYNYNTMKIDDEKFYLDGENTMFNLRNGGGKSVLVQMIMAPFVNRRYRSTKDRSFESYFTTTTPTYILVEWELDDAAGYLLTGMVVRKKEASSDQNSKEKLDIINFVHEYGERNEYDIDNLPIVEQKNDRKIIKSFSNSKILFEELKKNRMLKFNFYDMNNPVTTKNYFNKLEEYKINYREWETIIKQINIKESGLSELFTKAKDSSGLVKEWFLPAIENKLNCNEDRIDNYRKLLDSYIKQYRENKANIDKKAKLELFNNLSVNLLDCCNEFIATQDKKSQIKNEIANVIVYLKENLLKKEEEEAALEGLIKCCVDNITELQYEEASINIYEKQDQILDLKEAAAKQNSLVLESESRKNSIIKKTNILECAKVHRQYQSLSKELQQKETELGILNKKNQDNAPHINNLGFTLKEIYEKELDAIAMKKSEKVKQKKNLEDEKEFINKEIMHNQAEVYSLSERKGNLSGEIKGFDYLETEFNNNYNFKLFRNIEAYFDEDRILSVDKEISDEGIALDKDKREVNESLLKNEEELKSKESERLKNIARSSEINNKLGNKNAELKEADKEIEIRKEIIRYIDFEETQVFDNEAIINAFDRKIDFIKEDEVKLKKSYENSAVELTKLKTGRILEIPKDIEEKLKEKDITITYGMEWLKKNGYSAEKNEKLVNQNPFIPYSLILDSKEIELLEKNCLDLFTSSPIAIINRKELENCFDNINGNVVKLNGINFFISFNKKLLNEVELLKLINEIEKELQNIQLKIDEKKENVKFYEEKRNFVKYSSLTGAVYEELKKDISLLNDEALNLRQAEITLENNILGIRDEIKKLSDKSRSIDKAIERNTGCAKNYKALIDSYEKYKKNKASLERVVENLKIIQNKIDNDGKRIIDIESELTDISNAIFAYTRKEEEAAIQLDGFNIYKIGAFIEKDKEDILAEYYALTKEFTGTENELKEKISELSKKFREVDQELNAKADRYCVTEKEYINEMYDTQKEFELKDEFNKEDANYNNLKNEYNKLDKNLSVENSKLNYLFDELKDKFDKDVPKAKSLLAVKEFKHEIEKLKINIRETENKKIQINKLKTKIEYNLTSLNEFNDFSIIDKMEICIDINKIDEAVGKLKRDLRNITEAEVQKEKNLGNLITDIETKDEFKQDSLFKEPVQTLKSLISNPVEFKEQLNLLISSYLLIIEKFMTDIELIEKEEGKILESLTEYIKDVHENIEKIDDNSSIIIGNKRLKMLNIAVADWEDNKEVYKVRLKDYIEQVRNQSIAALEKNEDIEDIISNKVNIIKLYDEVVGIGTINIKLYKIEEDRQRQIFWDEVSKNSGGEGFLSAFVILSSLLSYMRKDESDIFSRKESGKVLIMDNPFAQTSSAHLLKPLIDIAKKSNTQLICLTGLGGDSIYNRFDNIYVLNLVASKLKSGVKYLKSEHTKGEDDQEVIVASRFKIEEEQLRLF